MNRRELLRNSAVIAAIAVLGIEPDQVLSAEGDLLKCRMGLDIQVLDPSFMIGGSETSIQFACLPRLAIPVKNEQGQWEWEPSEYVEKITQDDPTHISFTLKPGFMWSGGMGEVSAQDVKFSFERMLQGDWRTRWPTLILVEVKDKYSGVIVLKSPFAATFLIGVASESGTILPKVAVKKLKDQRFTTELPANAAPTPWWSGRRNRRWCSRPTLTGREPSRTLVKSSSSTSKTPVSANSPSKQAKSMLPASGPRPPSGI
jgi:peptide/nickel transport system substrate-binding protein